MKKILALLALLISFPAFAHDGMSNAEYWQREASRNWTSDIFGFNAKSPTISVNPGREAVANLVAKRAGERLGSQWVDSAVRLAKLESGFNCRATGPKTRHGRAKGILQMLDGSARVLGYDPRRMHECEYGIQAGLAHMDMCIQHGVRTHHDMARCHVSGWGNWNHRLKNRGAERYRQRYVKMAMH